LLFALMLVLLPAVATAEVAVTVLIMFCSNVRGRESGRERISWSSCVQGEHEEAAAAAAVAGADEEAEADVASGDDAFVEEEELMAFAQSLNYRQRVKGVYCSAVQTVYRCQEDDLQRRPCLSVRWCGVSSVVMLSKDLSRYLDHYKGILSVPHVSPPSSA
jgi:hypothetical protein